MFFLPSKDCPYMERLASWQDEQNLLTYRPAGKHLIDPIEEMTYVAFMPTQDTP